MRIPVPKNKLVALTLVGALLTVVVAGALAFPIPGVTRSEDTATGTGAKAQDIQQAADVPTANENFTPAVQTQSGYDEEEHEEYEEEEHEDEEHDEAYSADAIGV